MSELRNSARERLARGEVSLGLGVRLARSVEIAKIARATGYDWLLLDLEHGPMSLDICAQISVAALDCGIAPLVRVPQADYAMATRALDGGALGIVMPHVNTAEEARAIVDHLKYPPPGHRSVAGRQPHFDFRPMKMTALTETLNAATIVIVMVETPRAVENAEAIAAVPGVDVVHIGTNDLAAEMGIPGEFGHARIEAAYASVTAACRRHGKAAGMGGIGEDALMRKYIGLGVRFVSVGNDVAMLMTAAAERTRFLRGCPTD